MGLAGGGATVTQQKGYRRGRGKSFGAVVAFSFSNTSSRRDSAMEMRVGMPPPSSSSSTKSRPESNAAAIVIAGVADDRDRRARLPLEQEQGLVVGALAHAGVDVDAPCRAACRARPAARLVGHRVEVGRGLGDHRGRAPCRSGRRQPAHDAVLERVVAKVRAQRLVDQRAGRARRADARVDGARVVVGAGIGLAPPRIHLAAA